SSSTSSARPQGVAVVAAMHATLTTRRSPLRASLVADAQPTAVTHGSTYRSSICQRLPPPSGVSSIRADVDPSSGTSGTCSPPLEFSFPEGAQPLPGVYVATSVIPSTLLSRPYQTTRTRRPESAP